MKALIVTFLGTLLLSNPVFSMGGDKPGPNGGYITMPGPFHVELVEKEDRMLVYLLDISMKNPIIENSSVSLKFINSKKIESKCITEKNYFYCLKPKDKMQTFKEIRIEAVRNKVKSSVAVYKLPLKFE